MYDYDLIVIGGGPGGYEAAVRAAGLGLKTALVEKDHPGGTCLNRGCIPTKVLLHASDLYNQAKNGALLGVSCDPTYDLRAMYDYKRQTVEKLRGGVEALLKSSGVSVLRGTGTLTAKHTVTVGDAVITSRNILLATGSAPSRPPIPGLELPGVITSDELLEDAPSFRSVVIIGGGVIGVEFATFFSDLGVGVTIVEGLDRLLPQFDREIGQNLSMIMKKRGVGIFTGAMVKSVTKAGQELSVNFESGGKQSGAVAGAVLCAIGRRPFTDGLFGEGIAPETDGRRIKVNERFETSIEGVYAIGDVSSKIQLAHVATAQGICAVNLMTGNRNTVDLSVVPSCVYTRPEIASVGLTEQEAKESGIPVRTGKATTFSNGRTVIVSGARGFMKIVAHAETKKILGAQFMCENASDMIGSWGEAIANGMTPADMMKAMRPHPTFEEAVTPALEDLAKKLG
ncbi:MAG: dihydrolipoyl dehydrogenase [Clostridia bacterium]|nr:dihydrolipoyl dehydrogenase [Clostridia bacterium]